LKVKRDSAKGEIEIANLKEGEITTNIIVPVNLWEQAKIAAMRERISLGEFIRRALKERLAKKEPKRGRSDRFRGG